MFTLFVFCIFLVLLSAPLCSQNIIKQIVNIAGENLTDHSFLSRYHYTKSKNNLKERYRIRYWIPMFIGTPCTNTFYSFKPTTLSFVLVISVCMWCIGNICLYVMDVFLKLKRCFTLETRLMILENLQLINISKINGLNSTVFWFSLYTYKYTFYLQTSRYNFINSHDLNLSAL